MTGESSMVNACWECIIHLSRSNVNHINPDGGNYERKGKSNYNEREYLSDTRIASGAHILLNKLQICTLTPPPIGPLFQLQL